MIYKVAESIWNDYAHTSSIDVIIEEMRDGNSKRGVAGEGETAL